MFTVLLLLTGKTDFIWIAVAVVFLMSVITAYYFCCKLKDVFRKREEIQRGLENEKSEKIYKICNAIIDTMEKKNEDLSGQLMSLTSIQEKMINDNNILCQKLGDLVGKLVSGQSKLAEDNSEMIKNITGIVRNIKETDSQHMEEMNRKFIEHSDQMRENQNEKIDKLTSELSNGINSINSKYGYVMDEMSKRQAVQIEQWTKDTKAFVTNTQNDINTMICYVEKHLTGQSDELSRKVQDSIKNSQESITGIVTKNQSRMQEQYEMLKELNHSVISDIKELLEENLGLLIEHEGNTKDMLSRSIDQYCQQFSENVTGFTNDNASKMIASCESILNSSLKQICEANETTDEKRSVAFEHYMDELKKVYNGTIEGHIKALEEQVKKSISEFSEKNKDALEKNNELAAELISNENNFLSELEKNNAKLRETLQNAFEEYSKSVEGNITEFKNVVTKSIAENGDYTQICIDDFAGKNKETIELFAEQLKDYSDGFVDKSAQAIANVQADNNMKLQELCDRVSAYAQENSDFIVHCKEANADVNDNINNMVHDRNELINEMKVVSGEHIEKLDDALKTNVMDMNQMLKKVNVENANRFSETMVNYRDRFVEANADALATVQKDNVDSITEANKKIIELAEGMKKFRENIVIVLNTLVTEINEGLETQTNNSQSFYDDMDMLFDSKLSEYDSKLKKYNEIFSDLSTKIQAVIEVCENNTSKYSETLKLISNRQKEANELNNKDIELLKSLMKR